MGRLTVGGVASDCIELPQAGGATTVTLTQDGGERKDWAQQFAQNVQAPLDGLQNDAEAV